MIWLNCKFITLLASHLPETLYLSYKSFPHSYHFSWEVMESNHPMRKATWFLTHHFTMTNFRCWSLDYVITMHFCLGVWSILCTHLEVFQLHLARRHCAFSKHSIHRISQIFNLSISAGCCNIFHSQARYQLRYNLPYLLGCANLNCGPLPYQGSALTNWATSHYSRHQDPTRTGMTGWLRFRQICSLLAKSNSPTWCY